MSAQTTMAAAPTSAGTRKLAMSVTVPLGTNSWTKRHVEVKKKELNYRFNAEDHVYCSV